MNREFNKDIKTTKQYWKELPNNSGMLLENPENWQPIEHGGEHDALQRTSYGYIIQKKDYMLQSILDCFELNSKNEIIKLYRQADHKDGGHTTSRDAVIMALSALFINNDRNILNNILKSLKIKLSKKFNMSIPMYFWVKNLKDNKQSYLNSVIFNFFSIFENFFSILFNKILDNFLEFKKIDNVKEQNQPNFEGFKKYLYIAYQPDYAHHLQVQQTGTSKDNFLKKINQKILLSYTEKNNFILRYLLNDKTLTIDEINNYIYNQYIPTNDVLAQRRFDGTSNIYLRELTRDEAEYNDINININYQIIEQLSK